MGNVLLWRVVGRVEKILQLHETRDAGRGTYELTGKIRVIHNSHELGALYPFYPERLLYERRQLAPYFLEDDGLLGGEVPYEGYVYALTGSILYDLSYEIAPVLVNGSDLLVGDLHSLFGQDILCHPEYHPIP